MQEVTPQAFCAKALDLAAWPYQIQDVGCSIDVPMVGSALWAVPGPDVQRELTYDKIAMTATFT
jgi:hypothetical protein